jgi:hypothetical protein
MSLIIDIADAVVSELNATPPGSWAQPFTAVRAYRPVYDLADLAELKVTVVPRSVSIETTGRRVSQHDCQVDIAVQRKLTPAPGGTDAEIDNLMVLVQQIADRFRYERLAGYAAAVWIKTTHTAIYAPEHLEQLRQFTSVLTLTFRVHR